MTFQITTPTGGSDSLNFKNFSGTSIGSIAAADGANNALTVTTGSAGSTAVVFDNNQNTTVNYLSAQNTFGFKNRIINGAMVIDQRNSGASVTNSASTQPYCLDRWWAYGSQSSKYTVQQNAGSVTPPVGFSNYLGVTSLSSYTVGSSEQFRIAQAIEGYNVADLNFGSANAKTVTLSFWVRSSLTGSFGGSLNNGDYSRSYPFLFTINSANTWEQKTITVAGDTTGTWQTTTSAGLWVLFSLGVGSALTNTAGAWVTGAYINATGATSVVGTNGATFYITGVQLEKGNIATSFEYRDYGRELIMCQRYYQQINGNSGNPYVGSGYSYSTSAFSMFLPTAVTMRAPPSWSHSGAAITDGASYGVTISAIGNLQATTNGVRIEGTTVSASMVSQRTGFVYIGSGNYVYFVSEL